MPPLIRRVAQAGGLLLLVGGIAYTVSLVLVLATSQIDQRRPADAIVVLGAAQYNGRPSPVLRARLDHALGIWRAGLAPRILVTGGIGPGDRESEAAVGRRYLVARDVPADVIVELPQGRSTAASMSAAGEWMSAHGLRSAILVSDPFHMFRVRLEARRTGLVAYTSPTISSPISDNPVTELRYLFVEAFKIPVAWARIWL